MERPSRVSSSKAKASQAEKDKGKGKLVATSKKGNKVPKSMNAPLKINEGGHNNKKAQVVSESETETESESVSEEEEQTLLARKRKIKKKIPYVTYHTALTRCKEVQTRWADVGFLTKIGIFDDVRMVLMNIGLGKLLDMDYVCYHKQVLELIASFDLSLNRNARTPNQLGHVTFTVDHRRYLVNIKEICEAYGFRPSFETSFVSSEHQDKKVWKMIGKGRYIPGKTKSKWISNPAIRYVHKIIANTIFARAETDKINEDEMALLTNGLQPIFKGHFDKEGIDGNGNVNLGVILAKRILYTKKWALREERNKTALHIGGFLTPLLEVARVPLGNPSSTPIQKIDFALLKRMNFVNGKHGEQVSYTFIGSDSQVLKVRNLTKRAGHKVRLFGEFEL